MYRSEGFSAESSEIFCNAISNDSLDSIQIWQLFKCATRSWQADICSDRDSFSIISHLIFASDLIFLATSFVFMIPQAL